MKKNLIGFIYYLYNKIVFSLGHFRAIFWSLFMIHVGRGSFILNNVKIITPRNIYIGDNVGIADYCYLSGEGGITIGNFSQLGAGASIISRDHGFSDKNVPFVLQKHTLKPVKLGYNVWLGKNCIILKGVTIGDNSIIGAGAVVTKDVPSNCIFAGNPAKFIKNI